MEVSSGHASRSRLKESKIYRYKLRRHKDAVMALHSPDGLEGDLLISGSADHTIRIWNLREQVLTQRIDITRPNDSKLSHFKDNQMELLNYASSTHILNSNAALKKREQNKAVSAFAFQGSKVYTGYEDGLICCWSLKDGKLVTPLVGHTNKINFFVPTPHKTIYSCSNDCTIRQWDADTGLCIQIFKFSDPASCGKYSPEFNFLFIASWDKMVRCVDLEDNKIVKSFVASKEPIKAMEIYQDLIIVAGCEPIIRTFNIETGESGMLQGHKSWVYFLQVHSEHLFSAGDDREILIWDLQTGRVLENLKSHENGITSLGFAYGDLFSASYDHNIICWDLDEIWERIEERCEMRDVDVQSRKIEVFTRAAYKKGFKRKLPPLERKAPPEPPVQKLKVVAQKKAEPVNDEEAPKTSKDREPPMPDDTEALLAMGDQGDEVPKMKAPREDPQKDQVPPMAKQAPAELPGPTQQKKKAPKK